MRPRRMIITGALVCCMVWTMYLLFSPQQFPNSKTYKNPVHLNQRVTREQTSNFVTQKKTTADFGFIVNYDDQIRTFSYIRNNQQLCTSDDVWLLILVASDAQNFEKRMTFRKTWGSVYKHRNKDIRTAYLLGLSKDDQFEEDYYDYERDDDGKKKPKATKIKVRAESFKYNDVIQGQFVDKYENLTIKTAMGLQWSQQFCSTAKYVFKTDDDMIVSYKNLVDYLITLPDDTADRLYAGVIPGIRENYKDKIKEDKKNDEYYENEKNEKQEPEYYYEDPLQKADNKFHNGGQPSPPFCSGSGYVLSQKVIKEIGNAAKDMKYTKYEDVFVGKCAKRIQVEPQDYLGFHMENIEYNYCVFNKTLITAHNAVSFKNSIHQTSDPTYIWKAMNGNVTEHCNWWMEKTLKEKKGYIYKMLATSILPTRLSNAPVQDNEE